MKHMKKICINNRDEMIILFVDNIAYIMADGNYTKICYIGGLSTVLSLGTQVSDLDFKPFEHTL